ncbi:MAG: DNA phosphorothioation system restriction enzyme [Aestuariivita sp.]|nr:DNA phosphorothioation system restriction enzyme [Aestuariivita sp.]MCY4346906.1 DNA phosphorothioation system restriction enzyme [Aestuariivita sp.]
MSLKCLDLPLQVTTSERDPIEEFFDPVLERAQRYDIAVGYFSSTWLRDAAHGISSFALNDGRARWVISPELSSQDLESLQVNGQRKEERVREFISQSYQNLYQQLKQQTREALGWLIHDGVLSFKIGIPKNHLSGIMHAKQGLFTDEFGNRVGFSGSYNLTGGANTNWEVFSVFCDWRSRESRERNDEIARSFDRMWNSLDPNLSLYDPNAADLERFTRAARTSPKRYVLFPNEEPISQDLVQHSLSQHSPSRKQLRDYQSEGIEKWLSNNGRGILCMATGTGKTFTALNAVERLNKYVAEQNGELCVVVTVPYQHLAEQWASEAKLFGFDPVLCYGGIGRWLKEFQRRLNELSSKTRQYVMLIVVNASMSDKPFQSVLRSCISNILFIGDEVHNLGAATYLKALPENAAFRLGLTATPDRYEDEQGTEGLKQYFGGVVLDYGLKEAIRGGHLCRYRYFPRLVKFDDDEQAEYADLSLRIGRMYGQSKKDQDQSEKLKQLLIKRARLIGKARNKIPALIELLKEQSQISHTLVYCGDSKENTKRHLDSVLERIGNELGIRASPFTSDESSTERTKLLNQFTSGEIQVLLAIKCLDEGVDVPMTKTAYFMASSTNPKQFVQRRGRVLRRSEGKSQAVLYDFIVVPDLESLSENGHSGAERSLMKKELARFNEFARLAENYGEALSKITEIKRRLNLLDH